MSGHTRIPPSANHVRVMALDADAPEGAVRVVAILLCDETGAPYASAIMHPLAAASVVSSLIHETDAAMNGQGDLPKAYPLVIN